MATRAGNRGMGRKKGVPNKLTRSAKEAFILAFSEMGGAEQLTTWARANPTEFYKLFARLIPVDVQSGDKPLALEVVVRRE